MRKSIAAATSAMTSDAALALAGERAVLLTLPTGPFIRGAGLAVGLSAAVTALGARLPALGTVRLFDRPRLVAPGVLSWCSAILLALLVLLGWFGPRDPAENLLPLVVWTLIWVLLPLLTVLFGDLRRDFEPWGGPVRSLRRLLGLTGTVGLSRLGAWPAALGLFAFTWFEIVSPAPDDPARLATVVACYWLVIFLLALVEGEGWLRQGEFLTVFFGLLALIAPVWARDNGNRVSIMAGWPGARVADHAPLSSSLIAFVCLALASVSFDGLHQTFLWVGWIGLNPLDYPGRSAVVLTNTFGLAGAWAAVAILSLGALTLMRALTPDPTPFSRIAGPLLLSFVPIAAAYHIAHYLVLLLTQGQYVIAALSDPLGRGADLFHLGPHWIGFGFLAERGAVWTIWLVQFCLVLGAHLLAVVLAEQTARRAGVGLSTIAQIPLAVLMVLYTCFGLWLLATPAIG